MQIKPWIEVPVYNGGAWKKITDDGVYSAAGYLSPDWINTFNHNEKNYQACLVNHFPSQFTSMSQTAPDQISTGMGTIGMSISQIIAQLNMMLKDPKVVTPPKTQNVLIEKLSEIEDLTRANMSGFSEKKLPDFLIAEQSIYQLIDDINLESQNQLFYSKLNGNDFQAQEVLTIIAIIGAAISLTSSVWGAISSMSNDPGILKSPWGEYCNADGSITHIYSEWYQGSPVRLKYVWGNNERSIFIKKRSDQLNKMMDLTQLRNHSAGKLPKIVKPVHHKILFQKDNNVSSQALSQKKTELPMAILEHLYFNNLENPIPMSIDTYSDCPLHVQQSLQNAKHYIQQYSMIISNLSANVPSKYQWAKNLLLSFAVDIGTILAAWSGGPVVGTGAAILVAINRLNHLDGYLDLLAYISEIRTYKHAISEWASFIERTRSSHPMCFN